jgi:hypothetical protein
MNAQSSGAKAPVAGSSRGTVLWHNWRRYAPDRVSEAFEVSLYSDSDIIGEVRQLDWPVDLIPTITDPVTRGLRFVLVARMRWCLEPSPPARGPVETTVKSYYGGQAPDEIAALLSLALGVRCRSGGITRQWFRDTGDAKSDPLGHPMEFDHRPPMWTPPLRGRPLLPELPFSANVEDAVPLLNLLPKISGKNIVTLVRAARLYANALWVCDGDPNLGWLQMVSAVEAVAAARSGTKPVWKRIEQEMPDLWELLLDAGGQQHAENVGAKLAHLVQSTDRFTRFMDQFAPGPPAQRPEEQLQIDWSELPELLRTIYDYRSRALHDGLPFPAPMCEPPMTWGTDVPTEKPPWISSQDGASVEYGASVWAAEDIPMYLHTFEYLARGALLAWWRSLG